ncbi:tRNA lysidine(34) synthetase TilS [Lapidilactobacillus luobeiensis]|uniref:tRNA lysidine(34) synthetase TilS n=1 Tax=Lapidilactobacillus luobeiensis TaxID=2950371 RepID=UPI0021C2C6E4|nr:tRNA lysidine(34) synthetase TilS [Lapidilactobacillus luobeiensis]
MLTLERRFAEHWSTLAVPPQESIVVAFSGGVDSVVLVELLLSLPEAQRPQLHLAYFNHCLRTDSEQEERFVTHFAETHQLPLTVDCWQRVAATPITEASARVARYRFLTTVLHQQNSKWLLTAHHQDDLLETLLLRLIRSGGFNELPGLRTQTAFAEGWLLRPLLPFSKAELRAQARRRHWAHIEDSTNQTLFTQRNRLRLNVIPQLKAENPQILTHVSRFAAESLAVQELAQLSNQRIIAQMALRHAGQQLSGVLPEELAKLSMVARQLMWQAFWQQYLPRLPMPKQGTLEILAQLSGRRQGHHQVDLGHTWRFEQDYRAFTISQVPLSAENLSGAHEQVAKQQVIQLDQWLVLPQGRIGIFTRPQTVPADHQETRIYLEQMPDQWILRTPQAEDQVMLATGHHQKLRRRLIDQKVPLRLRERLWVLTADKKIVWVENIFNYKLWKAPETAKIIYVLWQRNS